MLRYYDVLTHSLSNCYCNRTCASSAQICRYMFRMEGLTVVKYRGKRMGHHCGYCGGDFGKISYGMPSHVMSPFHYQALIDRGWRRSGTYCYKPVMDKTCCPQYTIRCRALEYELTKSRKKVLNKMRQFLSSEDYSLVEKWKSKFEGDKLQKDDESEVPPLVEYQEDVEEEPECSNEEKINPSISSVGITESLSEVIEVATKEQVKRPKVSQSDKMPSKRAKISLLEKKAIKQDETLSMSSGGVFTTKTKTTSFSNKPLSLRDRIAHLNPDPKFKKTLEIRTVRAHVGDKDFELTRKESFHVYQKYQRVIHGDSPYHCTEDQWENFLVNCSILPDPKGPGPGFGNYHQQYVVDGKIIAVGVIDILPNCLSSVYFYYDPDFGFLSLGTYSALSEIAYTQKLNETAADLQYYYMGFYIHSCTKMRYKGGYSPSDLLCPVTYSWTPIELCVPALDEAKYVNLSTLQSDSSIAVVPENLDDFDVSAIGIYYHETLMNYAQYKSLKYCDINSSGDGDNAKRQVSLSEFTKRRIQQELTQLKEYVSLIGTDLATKIHLVR